MRRLIPFAVMALLSGGCAEARKASQGPRTEPATSASEPDQVKETGPADHNPRDVVERAILVHGGPLQLARLRNYIRTEKGEITSFGASVGGNREAALALPDKGRWTFVLQAPTQKIVTNLAIDGDKGWRASGGQVKDLTKHEIDDLKSEAHLNWMMTLAPLTGAGIELTALPQVTVNEKPALGVKVTAKDRPDLKLYFDKQTGQLVRAERPGWEAELAVVRAYLFSEPKEFGGVKLPSKQIELMNGSKIAEWTITGYKPVDSLPDSTFSKP